MNQSWGSEPYKHEGYEDDHDYNHPEILPEPFLKVWAMHKDTA